MSIKSIYLKRNLELLITSNTRKYEYMFFDIRDLN